MTNILYGLTTIPSTKSIPMLLNKPITSPAKSSAPLIIQSASLNSNQSNTLLTKRVNAIELGDLLMKKIKNKSTRSEDNMSPNTSNFDESSNLSPISCKLEQPTNEFSMVEEVASPSVQMLSGELEIPPVRKFPSNNRSLIIPGKLIAKSPETEAKERQRQVHQALDLLQKKMMIQQVASLTEAFLKEHLAQQPLSIPPFMATTADPVKINKEMFSFDNGENEVEIIIGPVEFPLLSMAPKQYAKASNHVDRSLLGSLCATRAETQRSESEEGSSMMAEDLLQDGKGRKKRATKKETTEKIQKKEVKVQKRGRTSQKKGKSCFSETSQSP